MSDISLRGFDDARGCGADEGPRGARQRREAFGKVRNCRGTTFKVPKIIWWRVSMSWKNSLILN